MPPSASRTSSEISIHALREEGDWAKVTAVATGAQFLSTPSARRATEKVGGSDVAVHISIHALREEGDIPNIAQKINIYFISIHALREEGDFYIARGCRRRFHFYPRPPRGGRQPLVEPQEEGAAFLSTPSARRATKS